MRGRKPKPTVLKIAEGAQKCRTNFAEPVLASAGDLAPPKWLGSFGEERWRELAPVLGHAGLLTVGDLPAFEQLCDEYDTIRRDALDTSARDRYRRLLVEFGLTPSSRSRIKITAEAPKDRLQELLDKRPPAKKAK
jgi:phage terminase small subunit